MKDYSKFIQSSYGFITKYEIKGNQILVYTAENDKDESQIYPATKEMITYIDNRLGDQYKLVLKNRDVIKEDFTKRKCGFVRKISNLIMGMILFAGLSLSTILSWSLPLVISLLLVSITVASSIVITDYMERKFDEQLDTYQMYLNCRGKIEQKRDEDWNVIRNLSESAAHKIEEKEYQKDSGLIDAAFNIDLMDKLELQDLRKLLTSYRICEELKSKQTFVIPKEYKKKVKKKNENNVEE